MHQPTITSIFRVKKRTATKHDSITPHAKKLFFQHEFTNQTLTRLEQRDGKASYEKLGDDKASYEKLGDDNAYQTVVRFEEAAATVLNGTVFTKVKN